VPVGAAGRVEEWVRSSERLGAGAVGMSVMWDTETKGAGTGGAPQRGGIAATGVATLGGPPMGAVEVVPVSARVGPGTAARSRGGATPRSMPGSVVEDDAGIFCCSNLEDHKVVGDKHALVGTLSSGKFVLACGTESGSRRTSDV
jgi:hypothetical protein